MVKGAEEKVREESPISIWEQILDQKGEVEKGQDSTICPIGLALSLIGWESGASFLTNRMTR